MKYGIFGKYKTKAGENNIELNVNAKGVWSGGFKYYCEDPFDGLNVAHGIAIGMKEVIKDLNPEEEKKLPPTPPEKKKPGPKPKVRL